MSARIPIVVVLGATGTGKSKLAIQLAKKFNGEIISADSMQFVLEKRLENRADEMMEMGLIEELEQFHEQYNLERLKYNIMADYTKGIFQSIGLKEFHEYLMLSRDQKNCPDGLKKLNGGVKQLKLATYRYSRNQNRYVSNHYIRVPREKQVPPVFELDCTDVDLWEQNVASVACDIVGAYLHGEDLSQLKYLPVPIEEPDEGRFQDGKYFCDTCQRVFIGEYQWRAHHTSKGHRKQIYQLKVKEFQKKIVSIGPTVRKEPNDPLEDDHCLELFYEVPCLEV